jgi:hypothetical protein
MAFNARKKHISWVWWCFSVILALANRSRRIWGVEGSLDHIVSSRPAWVS